MKPKLILLNGTPGLGKTTLAQRYIAEHPLAMCLDIDFVWFMLGQWQAMRPESDRLKLKYSYEIAKLHLQEGYDVIVPNLFQVIEQYEMFDEIAHETGAELKELVLTAPLDMAIERLKTRGRANGYKTGWRPGGVMDTGGREKLLAEMYDNVQEMIALRPNIVQIKSVEHDIDGNYEAMIGAISG